MGRPKKNTENKTEEVKEIKNDKKVITDVSELPGVGEVTCQKLCEAGFDNLLSIAVSTPKEIVDVSGLTEVMARKLIKASRDNLNMGFKTGNEVRERRSKQKFISFGSKALDKMMGGGLHTGSITEFYGAYGSCKTQIAHLLCVNIQKEDPSAIAVYIDSESCFRNERIEDFSKAAGLDVDKVLNNIKVARVFNTDHQMYMVEKIEELLKQGENIKLVVVDSLTSLFRSEFVARGQLADRQQKLNKHMHYLSKIAEMYGLAVYVTNQVMAKPDSFFGDPTEPIGGHIVGHSSQYRVYLRRGKKGSRVAKLVDAPELKDDECNFMVTEGGLEDLE